MPTLCHAGLLSCRAPVMPYPFHVGPLSCLDSVISACHAVLSHAGPLSFRAPVMSFPCYVGPPVMPRPCHVGPPVMPVTVMPAPLS